MTAVHTLDLANRLRGSAGRAPGMTGGMPASRVLAFDVNETLLDLGVLDGLFEDAFGDAALRQQWFAQMLQLGFVGAITGRYVDFTSAQRAALAMVAERAGVAVGDAAAGAIVDRMRTLPPHPEVAGALTRLRDAGFRLAALTNSPLDVVRDQLRNAELEDRFAAALSADQVRALKPRREPYELVAETFGVELAGVRLVAAHAWDVAGALAAGCAAAFVARPGMVLSPLSPPPDIAGPDLGDVAERIVAAGG
jgi:2-haloacid dehalogenase